MSGKPLIVGNYAIAEAIARGGMGTVHLAKRVGAGGFSRVVAIKRMHPQYAHDPHFAKMFLDEATLASRIRHPNVVATTDVVQSEGELLLVMDYVHGLSLATLTELLPEGERVPLPIAAAILVNVLHGLAAAHAAKAADGSPLHLVHRDVSPHNVVVGVDGVARVVDFGVAKARGKLALSQSGAVPGKHAYMAPEQLRGREVSSAADVYSAAVVLWELLAGRRLFKGVDGEVVEQVLLGDIPAPSVHHRGLDPAWDDAVLHALAYAPADRTTSADALASAIAACTRAATSAEVGAWVTCLASSALAERDAWVQALEREPITDADDADAPLASQEPSPPLDVVASPPAHDTSSTSHVPPPRRASRRLGFVVALGCACALAALAARFVARSRQADDRTAAALRSAPASSLIARSIEGAPPPSLTDTPAAASASAPASALTSVPATSPSSLAMSVPATSPSSRAVRAPPVHGSGTTHRSTDCQVPYVVNERGQRVYKRECLR